MLVNVLGFGALVCNRLTVLRGNDERYIVRFMAINLLTVFDKVRYAARGFDKSETMVVADFSHTYNTRAVL